MLTLEKCEKILNKNEKKYSTEQVEIIRDWLYQILDIEININNDIFNIDGTTSGKEKDSHRVRSGK